MTNPLGVDHTRLPALTLPSTRALAPSGSGGKGPGAPPRPLFIVWPGRAAVSCIGRRPSCQFLRGRLAGEDRPNLDVMRPMKRAAACAGTPSPCLLTDLGGTSALRARDPQGAKFPLGGQTLALFGKFSGRNREPEAKMRQTRHVSGFTSEI